MDKEKGQKDKLNQKIYPYAQGDTPRHICGPLPKTLSLFMTKICDIPYPDQKFKTLFMA